MSDVIQVIKKFQTPDGQEFSSREMAEYHLARMAVFGILMAYGDHNADRANDILNVLANGKERRDAVRKWLDYVDRVDAIP